MGRDTNGSGNSAHLENVYIVFQWHCQIAKLRTAILLPSTFADLLEQPFTYRVTTASKVIRAPTWSPDASSTAQGRGRGHACPGQPGPGHYAPLTGRGRQTTSAMSGWPACSRYIRKAWTL